jgi:hypothetical protein
MNQFNVQLRQVLGIIVKYHFWILCGLVVLIGVGTWLFVTSGLARATEERRTQLLQAREQVSKIRSIADHPNKRVLEAIQQEHRRLIDIVYRAWEELYRDQRERNKWPQQLGQEFLNVVNSLGPDEEIPVRYREIYQYFIKNHFPEWYDIVDLRLPPKRDAQGNIMRDENGRPLKQDPFERPGAAPVSTYGGGGYTTPETSYPGDTGYPGSTMDGRRTGPAEDRIGIVEWNMQDLQRIRAQFDWPTTPSTFEVRIAQENLWVYEALLRIIRETNEGATSYYNAAIKRIESLQIGQEAAISLLAAQSRLFGAGMLAGGAAGPGGSMTGGMATMPGLSPGMPMGGPMMPGPMMPGMGMSSYYGGEYGPEGPEGMAAPGMRMMPGAPGATAQSAEELIRQRLTHFRYVDKDGKPLAADAPHPFAEFKMMPVRMLLFMDQRRIPRLLVNCANSSMPVQVRVVSLRPGQGRQITQQLGPQATPGYPGMMSPMGGLAGLTSPYGMTGTYLGGEETYTTGYGYGDTTGQPGRTAQETGTIDVPVEVAGIIFIFNPPDRTKVGKIGEAEAPGATGMPTLEQALSSMAAPAGAPASARAEEAGAAGPAAGAQPVGPAAAEAGPTPATPPTSPQAIAPQEGAGGQPPQPTTPAGPQPPGAAAPGPVGPSGPQPAAPVPQVPEAIPAAPTG